MRDLSKEDLKLFQAYRHGETDQAIRLLAMRLEELTDLLDELTKALPPLAQQHKAIAEAVAMLTQIHPPGSAVHQWPERNQG